MSSFNLVQIVPSLNSGGVERGTVDVANFLAEKKIKNFIITSGGNMIKELNDNFVHVHQLPVSSKNFFLYPSIGRKINKFIQANNINLVHVRSRGPAWMINLMSKNNVKTIATFHNVYGGNSLIKKIYNKGLSKMDHLIAISDYVRETVIQKYNITNKNISVINRGIDTEYLNKPINNDAKEDFIRKHQIDKSKKIILFPARLTRWKGQLEFVDVIKKITTENILVLFAGDTKNENYTNQLREKINKSNIKNNFKILGSINKEEMRLLFDIADLSVSLPLRAEGFGRTISESLYSGTPVIAFNYGGAKNQLEHLSDFFKSTPKDYESLPSKIDLLLNLSEDQKIKILQNVKAVIENNYSKENMVNQYLEFYESVQS